MTAAEVYELTTNGGATDFVRLIADCERSGPYCLIGCFAVNAYVDAVYTLDLNVAVADSGVPSQPETQESQLRIQFTREDRYQVFLARSVEAEVLGVRVRVACLADVTQGKLWAYNDPQRRLSKRKKDELDLIRLAEAYPELKALYPKELVDQIDKG